MSARAVFIAATWASISRSRWRRISATLRRSARTRSLWMSKGIDHTAQHTCDRTKLYLFLGSPGLYGLNEELRMLRVPVAKLEPRPTHTAVDHAHHPVRPDAQLYVISQEMLGEHLDDLIRKR